MKVIATMDAGYSPEYRTTITSGQEYDIPETAVLPEFFTLPPASKKSAAAAASSTTEGGAL